MCLQPTAVERCLLWPQVVRGAERRFLAGSIRRRLGRAGLYGSELKYHRGATLNGALRAGQLIASTYWQVPVFTGHGGYVGCFGNAGIHAGRGGITPGWLAICLSRTWTAVSI